jgi:NADH dehydrogenase [ubiquinone] 1 alpha subcomplex assembly factor 7
MSLLDILKRRIIAEGPISIADYMAEALLHPKFGYYCTSMPFGAAGDFTTAPEISQMFGELIGLCLVQSWLDQGAPQPFVLAELGPGRGTLMADMLRAARQVPHFKPQIVLIEASVSLQKVQEKTLEGYEITWLERVEDLPKGPLFLVTNEFFDALPIRQFQRGAKAWREIRVGLEGGALSFGLAQEQVQPVLNHRLADTKAGDIVELCPALPPIMDILSQQIAEFGGAALIIDYGDWRSKGDTLQALKGHKPQSPLLAPGSADLTAHVDFEAIAKASRAACVTEMTPQGVFLERLGITTRAQALAQKLSGAMLQQHITAHRRLTHPSEMGNLFKVIGLYKNTAPPPPGLSIRACT